MAAPQDHGVWELNIVPDGDLVLILSNLDRHHGLVFEVFEEALRSMSRSDLDTLQAITTTSNDSITGGSTARKPGRPRNNKPPPLWSSYYVRFTPGSISTEGSSIRVRVSSQQFGIVSSVFSLFTHPSGQTGILLVTNGKADLPLPDDDAAAIITAMLIIFGKAYELPRTVSVGALSALCVLMDKYMLHGALGFHADCWYEKVKERLPTTVDDNFAHYLSLTHILEKEKDHQKLIEIGCQFAKGPLTVGMLPVPDQTLEKIDRHRVVIIGELREVIDDLLAEYKDAAAVICANGKPACDALGVDILELIIWEEKVLWTDVAVFSVNDLLTRIEGKTWGPSFCEQSGTSDCRDSLVIEMRQRLDAVKVKWNLGKSGYEPPYMWQGSPTWMWSP